MKDFNKGLNLENAQNIKGDNLLLKLQQNMFLRYKEERERSVRIIMQCLLEITSFWVIWENLRKKE